MYEAKWLPLRWHLILSGIFFFSRVQSWGKILKWSEQFVKGCCLVAVALDCLTAPCALSCGHAVLATGILTVTEVARNAGWHYNVHR